MLFLEFLFPVQDEDKPIDEVTKEYQDAEDRGDYVW
jgi:hypothetical protein